MATDTSRRPAGRHSASRLERLLGLDEPGSNDYDRRYLVYLIVIATAGWALASYDFNLLVTALPTIAKDLSLSQTQVGLLGFIVYGAMLAISLLVGAAMDRFGRKVMWQLTLVGAAVSTGLTYFVASFWALILVRALASGFANSELAISITLVNEQVPPKRRGFLYSVVQGGWPVGVLLASGVFLGFNNGLGVDWHLVFVFGVIPLLIVIVGRRWVRPSRRYQQLRELRAAKQDGDQDKVEQLTQRYDVDVEEIDEVSVRQLFTDPGWGTATVDPHQHRLGSVRRGIRCRKHLHHRLAHPIPALLPRHRHRLARGHVCSRTHRRFGRVDQPDRRARRGDATDRRRRVRRAASHRNLPHIRPGQELEDVAT
jgi:hypothetical protein